MEVQTVKVSALRPPRLRTIETTEERKVTWTELFYDLVFVVAVAGLGARLLDDPTFRGAAVFTGLFVPLWWAWAGFTFYADRYDTDDLGQRTLAVAQMVAIALMAASISGEETDSLTAFALAYVAARSILIVMYLRARRHVPETRKLVGGYVRGMSVAVALWLVSVFVPEPYRYILWAVGLLIDFYTPYRLRRIQAKVPLDVAHLPERFGLFTILVLGESMAATVAGISHEGWVVGPTVTGVLAVVVAAGLWWIYFDNLDGTVVRRRVEQQKAWKPTVWIYGHLPLVIGLMATAIGLEGAVIGAGGHDWPPNERWLLIAGIGGALIGMAIIEIATERPDNAVSRLKSQIRVAGGLVAVIIGLLGGLTGPLVTMVLLVLLCAGQVGGDVWLNEREAANAGGVDIQDD
jgi:low temperature requirement protein LtrA